LNLSYPSARIKSKKIGAVLLGFTKITMLLFGHCYNTFVIIQATSKIKECIDQLVTTHKFNMTLSDEIIRFLLLKDEYISKAMLTKVIKKNALNEHEAYRYILHSRWSKNSTLKVHQDWLTYVIDHGVTQLAPSLLTSNPFYQLVKPASMRQGQWQLTYLHYQPYQSLLVGDVNPQLKQNYLELTPLGYFTEKIPYLVILQKDVVWMSVTPFEIQTMQPVLDRINGSVLTFGLGLGYFAGMAAMKNTVTSVLVIERDLHAISLFMNHIYPTLPHKEKITIIQQDAFAFLQTNKQIFDHIFVDIYHTSEDGLPIYIQMKKIEQTRHIGQWHYWLEASILSLFRRYFILFLNEQMSSLSKAYYRKTTTFEDQLFRGMYLATQTKTITQKRDMSTLLNFSSLIKIIEKITIS
jgi:hypothetical protein